MNIMDLQAVLHDIGWNVTTEVEIELPGTGERVAIRSVLPEVRDGLQIAVIRCRSSL
jgi:hypothetical protein